MAGVLGVVGPLVGAGSALGGLFGGGNAGSVQLPPSYNYSNQAGADAGAYSGINNLTNYNVPPQFLSQYQNITQNAVNNPYAPQYQAGANNAGALGYAGGVNTTGQALSMYPDVQALLAMGFDPQNALYARTQQRVQDQQQAINSQSGVGTTPYGAGVTGMTNANFNIDWQNNALQRAATGANAAGGLFNTAAGGINQGVNQMTAGAGLPYNTFQGINTNALQTLAGLPGFSSSAAAVPQTQIQDFLAYLSGATGQQNANTSLANTALNQNALQFNQSQVLGGNLGSSLAGLAKGWSSPNNPFASTAGGGTFA